MKQKRGPKGITPAQYAEALRDTFGNISAAARRLNVDRAAVVNAIKHHESVKQAHDEAADQITDIAEDHLVSGVRSGDWRQVMYWLENKARDRGYGVKRTEISGPGGQAITFKFEDVIRELEQG